MKSVVDYIIQTYHPLSVIVYGSYADGSNDAHSDFDALVLVQDGEAAHDTEIVDKVQMDLWIYPVIQFQSDFDAGAILQIYDGRIVFDLNGIGAGIKSRVEEYVAALPLKSMEEWKDELAWCRKMLLRAERGDPEGMYRWHWLLTDSLQIACGVLRQHYFGPKKSLRWLRLQHPQLYELYARALSGFELPAMSAFLEALNQYTAS